MDFKVCLTHLHACCLLLNVDVSCLQMMQLEMTADLTEVQKQIMSELQVLYKVNRTVHNYL